MMKVENYVVKLRAYPSDEQKEQIEKILIGLRLAYNTTAYEISISNPQVTKEGKKDATIRWPDFSACMKKEWLDFLRVQYPIIKEVPATSLSSSVYGIMKDLKKSWENFHPIKIPHEQKIGDDGKPCFKKNGEPVWEKTEKPIKLPCGKWEPTYYSKGHPRTSFTVQSQATNFVFNENSKTLYIPVTTIGMMKARGWNKEARFGEDQEGFLEHFRNKELYPKGKMLGVTMSKDACGDYWITVHLQETWIPDKTKESLQSVGVDVGIKDVAITSDGKKYENRRYKKSVEPHLEELNRIMSRRQGWKNEVFRAAHRSDKTLEPSNRYRSATLKKARLERKVAFRRGTWNHELTADIVNGADFVAIESLNVSGMMQNRHLSYAVGDVALHDILSKIKYKADRRGIKVVEIGRFEPSSQVCSCCGYKNPEVKNLSVREWTCPECGAVHDRDVNAAKNILAIAKKQM